MSPRHASPSEKVSKKYAPRQGPSMDRDRQLEDARHHPSRTLQPHPPHKAIKKPALPRDHATHTRPHEEERGPHTDKPGPIRFSRQMNKPVTST